MRNPFEVVIQNQADDERIIRVWRHHPITLVGPVLRVIALMLIPLALIVITGFSMLSSVWLLGLFTIILAMVLTYAAWEWVSWYGDVYILSNYRIIDVAQHGFFSRKFAEATLDKVQDISHETTGVAETVFRYGDVLVQTAGAETNICLERVRDPQRQAHFLLKQQQSYLESHDTAMSAEDLIGLLAKHGDKLGKMAELEKAEAVERNRQQQAAAAKPTKRRRKRKPA